MREKKLFHGADLLDEWFSRFPNDNPLFGKPNTTVITMDFVLGFERAKKVHDQIISEKLFANVPAQLQIGRMLDRLKKNGSRQRVKFGDFTRPAPEIDKDYMQERAVDEPGDVATKFDDLRGVATGKFDDLTAALHSFNLRVAVKGFVELQKLPSGKFAQMVTIEEVGTYVQDKFDFNEDQPLGLWNGHYVENADFRQWRLEHNAGGDFLVFSDVNVTKLDSPVTFQMPTNYDMVPIEGGQTAQVPALNATLQPTPAAQPDKTIIVVKGATLSDISEQEYGTWELWPLLYDANKGTIGANPNVIKPGQSLTIAPLSRYSDAQVADAKRRAPTWKNFR